MSNPAAASTCPHAWRLVLEQLSDPGDLARVACVNRQLRDIAVDIRERRDREVLDVLAPVFGAAADWLEGVRRPDVSDRHSSNSMASKLVRDLEQNLRAVMPADAEFYHYSVCTAPRPFCREPRAEVLRFSFCVSSLQLVMRAHVERDPPWKSACVLCVCHRDSIITVATSSDVDQPTLCTQCVNPGPCDVPCGEQVPGDQRLQFRLVVGAWREAMRRFGEVHQDMQQETDDII